jgi:hypothetical protein
MHIIFTMVIVLLIVTQKIWLLLRPSSNYFAIIGSTRITYTMHIPKLSLFSGSGAASFQLWHYEVQCLLQHWYPVDRILQAIRQSLKGEASRIVMDLGIKATLSDTLTRLEYLWTFQQTRGYSCGILFSATEAHWTTEDASSWSCRLEDIMCRVLETKYTESSEKDSMLHMMLWIDLQPSLKKITGYLFDSIQSFHELWVALRGVEQEHTIDRYNCFQHSMEQHTVKPKPRKR